MALPQLLRNLVSKTTARIAAAAFVASAAIRSYADDAPLTLTITNPETAGIAGFRPLWDLPIPATEEGVVENDVVAEPGRTDYGVAPSAHWLPQFRNNGTLPGGLVFDAVHRSLLVKFPTAAQQIMAVVNQGYSVTKVELVLPLRDIELWPEYYRKPDGLSFLGQSWKNTPPRWHAVATFLRRPWANDAQYGPTFNANINGISYWNKFGAQDALHDRFVTTYSAEISSVHPESRIDLTAALTTTSELGVTLPDRLDVLNNCGVILRKLETYDFLYWQGGYEWATMTGHRGILIHTPQLVVQFAPTPVPETGTAKPALDLAAEIQRVALSGDGGAPTAVLPTPAQFASLATRLGSTRQAWMSDWQWQRIDELNKLPAVPDFTEDLRMAFPETPSGFATWMDDMLSIEPRRWAGFDAAKKATIFFRNHDSFPGPIVDHWKLYWASWLMPDRPWLNAKGAENFIHAINDVDLGRYYYDQTHDWRGDASVYRTYVHSLGPQDFNYWASAGVMLGGAIYGSPELIAEGRQGFESFPLRIWSWAYGSTQESIDHYYFAITLAATKPFADYGPTTYDRLLGKVALTKSVEELATHYHPALRRFISVSNRTGPAYVFGQQDGLQHIIHTLSPTGALTDQGQTNVAGINILGHDVLPTEIATLSLDSGWAPDWFPNIVDYKALPFHSRTTYEQTFKTSYLGHNYGLASGLLSFGTVPLMAQWRRVSAQPASLRDIGTLFVRYGINRTDFLDTVYHGGTVSNANGLVGAQGGYIHPLQLNNKALVLSTASANLRTADDFRAVPDGITSLQTSIGIYNFQDSAGWKLYVDGVQVTQFPVSIHNSQRITIEDGVTFIGIAPLAATDLGRSDDVVISTDSPTVNLQGGGSAREAIRIDNYNFKSASAVPLSSFDSATLDAAWGGFAIEISDVTEYPDFAAFRSHFAQAQLTTAPTSGSKIHATFASGSDTISTDFDPTGYGGVSHPLINGADYYLPDGIKRLTDVSIQGTNGKLDLNGATLLSDPKSMAFLEVEPVSRTYMGVIGRTDSSRFVLEAPHGATIRSEGKVGIFRAAIRPSENKVWIDAGATDSSNVSGRAVIISGLAANPIIALDGKILAPTQIVTLAASTGPIYIIPLNGVVDSSLAQDYVDNDGNGLPDGWEMKWFKQLGNRPAGDEDSDGVSDALEFANGTNPVMSDAWIAKYLGEYDDNPYQDPGNIGRNFRESFLVDGNPWPIADISAGLRAWYRSDLGVSKNSGYFNQLRQWTDISGNGIHMLPVPDVTAPFWQSSIFNNRPGVFYQGSWCQLQSVGNVDFMAGKNDFSVITVLLPGDAPINFGTRLFTFGYDQNLPYGLIAEWEPNVYKMFWRDSSFAESRGPAARTVSGRVQVLSAIKNGPTASSYVDGALTGSSAVKATVGAPPYPVDLGTGYNGHIAEMLVYNRALTDDERKSIEQTLTAEYVNSDSDGDGLPDAWELKNLGTLAYGSDDNPGHVSQNLGASFASHLNPWPNATYKDGLRAWYRADLGTVKDHNDRVGVLPDLTGNGLHMVGNVDPARRPIWFGSAVNGSPAIQCNGLPLTTSAIADALNGSNDVTIVATIVPAQAQGYGATIFAQGTDGNLPIGLVQEWSNNAFKLHWSGSTGEFRTPELLLASGRAQVITVTKSGGTAAGYVNGVTSGAINVATGMSWPLAPLSLGAFNGFVTEILVYNRALSKDERETLEAQLASKYISADSDGDGLADAWELKYFGTLAYRGDDNPGGVGYNLSYAHSHDLNPWPTAAISTGLRAWFRADLGVTTQNGDVALLSDLSGNAMHVNGSTDPNHRPHWVGHALNDLPAIACNGYSLASPLPVDALNGSSDITIIAVAAPDAAQGFANNIISQGTDGNIPFGLTCEWVPNAYKLHWSGPTGEFRSPDVTTTPSRAQVITVVKNGTAATSYLDGVPSGTAKVAAGMTWPTALLSVGTFNGMLGEVLVYNRALTDAERQQIELDLGNRYAAMPVPVVASGLRAWYRGDWRVTKDTANNVTKVLDLSGNGFDVAPLPDAHQKPLWQTNAVGTSAGFYSNSEGLFTSTAVDALNSSNDVTIIGVLTPDPVQGYAAGIYTQGTDGNLPFGLASEWANNVYKLHWSGTTGEYRSPDVFATGGRSQIITVVKNGEQVTSYWNGISTGSSKVAAAMSWPAARAAIATFKGNFGEVLVYNRALSDDDRAKIERSLALKYIPTDSDADGLPDDWEMNYLGTLAYGPTDNPGNVAQNLQGCYTNDLSPWPTAPTARNLRAWYRADMGVTKDDISRRVALMADVSGHGLHVVGNLDPNLRPVLVDHALNGLPALQSEGTPLESTLPLDVLEKNTDVTIVAVISPAAAQGYAATVFAQGTDGNLPIGLTGEWANNVYKLHWSSASGEFRSPDLIAASGRAQVLTVIKGGDTTSSYINGTIAGSYPVSIGMSWPRARLALAGLRGMCAEVLVYNGALNQPEREQIEAYLTQKYIAADGDGDGLADAWELRYLGTLAYSGGDDPGLTGRRLAESQQQKLSPWPSAVVSNGLRAWYRSDLGVALSEGNRATLVADLSGNAFHVLGSPDPQHQPILDATALNGAPAIRSTGEGLSSPLPIDVLAGANDITIVSVISPDATQGFGASIWCQGTDGNIPIGIAAEWVPNVFKLHWSGPYGEYRAPDISTVPSKVQILAVTKSSGTATSYLDGAAVGTAAVGSAMTWPARRSILAEFAGAVGDVLVYNRALSDAERQEVERDLRNRYVYGIASLSPRFVTANSGGFTLTVHGAGFTSGATVLWSGIARTTTFVNAGTLTATIPASDLTAADMYTAIVTVRGTNGVITNAKSLAVLPPSVTTVQSEVITTTVPTTITTAPTTFGDSGVTAIVTDNATTTTPMAVSVANYATNPTPAPSFDVGGKFVDVQITGAQIQDRATTYFYYPATITGDTETQLNLQYFNGTTWIPVLSSGQTAPGKNTTDNLDGTVSGGRFNVVFDATSTPKVTELTGTVFTVSVTIPATVELGNLAQSYDGAAKAVTVTTNPAGLAVSVTYNGSSQLPIKVGTYQVVATITAPSYIGSAFGTLTIVDTTPPVLSLPGNLTAEATSASGAACAFSATASDAVDGPCSVTLSPATGSVFKIGTTTVTATATDKAGNIAKGSFTVTVRDTTAPTFTTVTASPATIWPANKKMVSVSISASATDAVGVEDAAIKSVTCNEPASPSAWQITGSLSVDVLADRSGNGTGRVYTITVEARDAAGNSSTRTVTVTVPHDQGK